MKGLSKGDPWWEGVGISFPEKDDLVDCYDCWSDDDVVSICNKGFYKEEGKAPKVLLGYATPGNY